MRTLLVTGASSEIGRQLILDCQDSFDRIIAHCSHAPQRLDDLKAQVGEKLLVVQADFSSQDATLAMIEKLNQAELIPTNIVHLPAGKFELKHFPKAKWEDFQLEIDISVRSIVLILQSFLPKMAKAHSGRVVLMLSSVTQGVPPKYLSYYTAAKYALLGLVRELSAEYAEKGISINGISPEMVDTQYLKNIPTLVKELNIKDSPRKRLLSTQDILPVLRMLLSEDAGAITGQNILISDGR